MNQQQNPTPTIDPKKRIRGELLTRGLTISHFAAKHGFKMKTVEKVIKRYTGAGKAPRGEASTDIMAKLEEELGIEMSQAV